MMSILPSVIWLCVVIRPRRSTRRAPTYRRLGFVAHRPASKIVCRVTHAIEQLHVGLLDAGLALRPADRKCCLTVFSSHALSCSATNDEGLRRVTKRILSSLSNSSPAASANERSARSRVSRIPSLRACRSQVLLSSSTQRPVNRPSTLSLTASIDDSTTVTFIPCSHPLGWNKQSACQLQNRLAE
jgi:hypothetical protein